MGSVRNRKRGGEGQQMKQMMQEANAAHEANEADVFPTSGRKAGLGGKKQATRKS